MMIKRFSWPARRLVLVVDNLYAKAKLASVEVGDREVVLISRLRSNAALYELPKRKRGRAVLPSAAKSTAPNNCG